MSDENLIDIARVNYPLVEALYESYVKDPKSIDPKWIEVFKALELVQTEIDQTAVKSSDVTRSALVAGIHECRIQRMIDTYRTFGHLATQLNPISTDSPAEPEPLKLENLGFRKEDLPDSFPTCGIFKESTAPLSDIINALKKTYCSRVGFEYMDLDNPDLKKWIQEKIEPSHLDFNLSIDQKKMILDCLNKSELFEVFLHTKFTGQKRFSLEGGETLIPMLKGFIAAGAALGVDEFVLGMAHRGRLNALANILNKSFADIFSEFDEGYFPDSFEGSGDVKYHKGFLSDVMTIHGHQVKISLTPNPSHLESVDAVIEGQVKGKQIKRGDETQERVMAILVHGDAALSGQGAVYESLQMYKLRGYTTGGTVHFVINNQIGFTTLPEDSRSTRYCTDIAKTFDAPVFHVNAEDPEACLFVALLAAEIRHLFHIDCFIDLNCYRKYGHNEGDEPAFTQPLQYQIIRKKVPIRELFRDTLIQEGVVEKALAENLEAEFKKALSDAQKAVKPSERRSDCSQQKNNNTSKQLQSIETGVSENILREIAERFCEVPAGFKPHPKLEHLLKERLSMVAKPTPKKPIDWGMGEMLALGSLLWNGTPVRLAGQDSGRGTFSHRHALWVDQITEAAYYPLSHLKKDQGRVDIINTLLSEYAALGFEYGYSTAYPETLVIWEAQFGDFANGAQVIIDQYISCAEQKWGQKSNLTLFLPHGYEGQGPEHSSARLERFLTLAANDNMFICNPTTPAQFFHLIRRQVVSLVQKPLIVMTPKVLLRHPDCNSSIEDLSKGRFAEILDDPKNSKDATRVLFCSGKIYYELAELRIKEKLDDLCIIRIEQLYPFDQSKLEQILKEYQALKEYYWVQEEHFNMGAWSYIHPLIEELLPVKLQYIGRAQSAAPATGSYVLHKKELAAIFDPIRKGKVSK